MTRIVKFAAAAALAVAAFAAAPSAHAAAPLPADANTTCPIMQKEQVNPDLFVDYKGERIFLCCNKCKRRFNEDPEKYVARVHAQDAASTATKKAAKAAK